MPVRITQLRTMPRGPNNEAFPLPDGHVSGQTMNAAGASDAMAAGTQFVEVQATENITIDGYGAGSEVWMFSGETRWFPARQGQTFTWSQRA